VLARHRTRTTVIAIAATLALTTGTAACGNDDESATSTDDTVATTSTTEVALALEERCENPLGFSITYPSDWSTNTEPAPEPCVWFAPTPIEVPDEATDSLLGPISVRIQEGVSFADASTPSVMFEEILTADQAIVAGRQAVRIESVATGEALLDEGTQTLGYVVELDPAADGTPRVLTAVAFQCCGVAFEESATTLDFMVDSLDITT